MPSLNKVLLIGNLTREPELRYTPNGSAVCELGMAINRTYTSNNEKKEEVCFVDVNVWGRQAESCSRYLQKGSPLFVEGRLQLDQWTDKESGKARSKLRVVAERTQFLGSQGRKDDLGGDQNDYSKKNGVDSSSSQTYNYTTPASNTGLNNNSNFPPPPANPPPPSAPAGNPESALQQPTQSQQGPATDVIGQPAAPQQQPSSPMPSAPQNAFNTNMESEDDIPF